MKKSKKIKELTQIDGKLDESEPKYAITSVYQLLGDNGAGVYKTDNVEEYEKELHDMNLADLQRHATQYGQIPITDRKRLINRLIADFQRHWGPFRVKSDLVKNKTASEAKLSADKELQKILNIGK